MQEAHLYEKLSGKKVRCLNCAHYCVLSPDQRGICGVRESIDGKLYSLNYGKIIACNIDPVEKKPFFHFLPGSHSLSVAAMGCNFKCASCQNYDISQAVQIRGEEIPPQEIVKLAKKNRLPGISYTYTEPAIFSEYALDTMRLAQKEGIKNCWVSNGFWSKELFDLISPHLNAANIDLKSFEDEFYIKYCGGKLQPVLDTLKRLKRKKVWVEITTLVIPALNDKEKILRGIADFIKRELDSETPWHVTRFSGRISWKLRHLPDTPAQTLKKAWQIGKKAGLKYVYTGNIPGLDSEDTFCPKCGAKMIDRQGYLIQRLDKNGRCSKCGKSLDLILD